jgi:single-stranded-DNA-specific exonuclease
MIKTWQAKKAADEEMADCLGKELNINTIIAKLLVQRGIEDFDTAKTYFRPSLEDLHDPFFMTDMDKAVSRLNDALFNEEHILIYGDYDVDGTTSVALVYNFLKEFYTNIDFYIPDRYSEGYGISTKGIDWADEHGYSLIVALDCGITAVDKVDYANEKSIDFIICDHHLPGDVLPNAAAVLDPKRRDCFYPYDGLSGCGVGFKLLQAFCIQNTIELEKLYNHLDLLAVSIASDIVPITDENRILAWYGLKKLNSAPSAGLKALIKIAGFKHDLDISNVVFGLGPRINAAGRINHAKASVDLLIADTEEAALQLATKLNINNKERREYDEAITAEALEMIAENKASFESKSTVLYHEKWHKGIVGIVASRCIEQYYKPTIILTESNGKATGSARSVEGFDVYEAIKSCAHLLEQFGGHKYAAGLTLPIENITAFQKQFELEVSKNITADQLVPKIKIDQEIDFKDIDFKLLNLLKQMGPFGPFNMQPVFITKNVVLKKEVRLLKELHLKLLVKQENEETVIDAIGFNLGQFAEKLDQPFKMAYTIEENNFMGNKSIQLNLKDIQIND